MLMKHGDYRHRMRFAHEIDRIGKLVKQGAAHVFFNKRKDQWIVRDSFERSANFSEESET